jgi:hypothetical protein
MNANELRIGNLVDCFGIREVVVIKKHKIKVQNEISEGHFVIEWVPIKSLSLKPIPLTEEMLLKCGFISGGAKQWLFITLDKKDECYLYFNPLGKGIAIDQNGIECSFEIELNYLHQLQNLYFALTNEELTINL